MTIAANFVVGLAILMASVRCAGGYDPPDPPSHVGAGCGAVPPAVDIHCEAESSVRSSSHVIRCPVCSGGWAAYPSPYADDPTLTVNASRPGVYRLDMHFASSGYGFLTASTAPTDRIGLVFGDVTTHSTETIDTATTYVRLGAGENRLTLDMYSRDVFMLDQMDFVFAQPSRAKTEDVVSIEAESKRNRHSGSNALKNVPYVSGIPICAVCECPTCSGGKDWHGIFDDGLLEVDFRASTPAVYEVRIYTRSGAASDDLHVRVNDDLLLHTVVPPSPRDGLIPGDQVVLVPLRAGKNVLSFSGSDGTPYIDRIAVTPA